MYGFLGHAAHFVFIGHHIWCSGMVTSRIRM